MIDEWNWWIIERSIGWVETRHERDEGEDDMTEGMKELNEIFGFGDGENFRVWDLENENFELKARVWGKRWGGIYMLRDKSE